MIEVIVHDVVARAATDAKWPPECIDNKVGQLRVILLKEKSGPRILPIWVGPQEGDAIALRLEHVETQRPMTFALMNKLLSLSNTKIEKVAVTALHTNTYFATMWLIVNGTQYEVDARPSDAITLALQADAPIFIAPETLEGNQQAITAEDEISQLNEQWAILARDGNVEPEPQPMEYKSMRDYMREYRARQNASASTEDQP